MHYLAALRSDPYIIVQLARIHEYIPEHNHRESTLLIAATHMCLVFTG
jgi:hypothetical protein